MSNATINLVCISTAGYAGEPKTIMASVVRVTKTQTVVLLNGKHVSFVTATGVAVGTRRGAAGWYIAGF
jgi:hypothetical protein